MPQKCLKNVSKCLKMPQNASQMPQKCLKNVSKCLNFKDSKSVLIFSLTSTLNVIVIFHQIKVAKHI
jgi:hypothetical protein